MRDLDRRQIVEFDPSTEDLCQGGVDVCNVTTATQNLQYLITDGKGDLIIDTQTNVQQPSLNYLPGQQLSPADPWSSLVRRRCQGPSATKYDIASKRQAVTLSSARHGGTR